MTGMLLPSGHSARFGALLLDARAIIKDELGPANDFTMRLIGTINDTGIYGPSYAWVQEASEVIRAATRAIARKAAKPTTSQSRPSFVDHSRIAELRGLVNPQWDFARLVELCRELNVAAANDCHMSTSFLLRSILNLVPPIFGKENFARVANEYPFAKSIKPSIGRLQSQARDGADFHLHQPIRKHEVLPTAAQVAFRQELDVLLGEVIRVVRESNA